MRKGALRSYVKKKYGKKGFTRQGTIKKQVLMELKKSVNASVRRMATFALNAREWGK